MLRALNRLQRYRGLETYLKFSSIGARNHTRQYASKCPPTKECPPKECVKPEQFPPKECPPGSSNSGLKAMVGTVLLFAGGLIAYAKYYDEDFRQYVSDRIPLFNSLLNVIFQEDMTHSQRLSGMVSNLGDWIVYKLSCGEEVKQYGSLVKEEVVPYTAPRSAFSPLLEEVPPGPCDPVCDKPYQEIRVLSQFDQIETLATNAPPEPKKPPQVLEPQEAVDFETQIGDTAKVAVESYQNAVNVIRDLSQNILDMVNSDPAEWTPQLWSEIRGKSQEQANLLSTARQHAAKARELVEELKRLINQDRVPGPDPMKALALKRAQRVVADIDAAHRQVEKELYDAGLGRNAWPQVLVGRGKWKEELLLINPDANLEEKVLNIIEEEMAVFALHAYINIQYYEKELALLEMGAEKKLQEALDAALGGETSKLIEVAVADKVNEERRRIELNYSKKAMQLRTDCIREIRLQLKANAEMQLEHLEDSLKLLEAEELRSHTRRLGELLAHESGAYRKELAAILGRVRGIDEGLSEHAQVDVRAQQAQELWAACQTFLRVVQATKHGSQLNPLEFVVKTIDQTATDSDELVKSVVKGIPYEALARGIYSTRVLRERFLKVEKVAQNLAALGSEGASLFSMFLSWAQANLVIPNKSPVSTAELKNEPVRLDLLNNYELLARARYWMMRGDLSQALKYMNLLKGLPRYVADDWMKETRLTLECHQAAMALVSHATALGMMYN